MPNTKMLSTRKVRFDMSEWGKLADSLLLHVTGPVPRKRTGDGMGHEHRGRAGIVQ